MTTQDFQRKKPLMIFLSYFKNHKKLFAIDMCCAVLIAAIDLLFPLVTRSALYEMLPDRMYRTFFIVMAAVVLCYVLRTFLNYIVCYYGHTFGIRVEADIRADLFRHMQELSYEEIGQTLKLPAGTVKSRLNRAKAQLKDLLSRSGNLFGAASVIHTEQQGKEVQP